MNRGRRGTIVGFGQGKLDNVPQTLRALKQIDPELRRRVPAEIKSYAQPMLAEIKSGFPRKPMSGWSNKGRLGWRLSSAKYKTTLQFRGTPPRTNHYTTVNGRRFYKGATYSNYWPILRVRSKHLALIIATTARKGHTDSGRAMVRKLDRERQADRFIWPIVEKHTDDIERGITASFRRYEKIVNRQLERR